MSEQVETPQDSKTHPVTVTVNNREVTLPGSDVTGQEIKAAAGVPLDFHLYIEQGDHLVEVQNDETIKIHPNERFRAVSGQDVS